VTEWEGVLQFGVPIPVLNAFFMFLHISLVIMPKAYDADIKQK
jgi:hypothetical protein